MQAGADTQALLKINFNRIHTRQYKANTFYTYHCTELLFCTFHSIIIATITYAPISIKQTDTISLVIRLTALSTFPEFLLFEYVTKICFYHRIILFLGVYCKIYAQSSMCVYHFVAQLINSVIMMYQIKHFNVELCLHHVI